MTTPTRRVLFAASIDTGTGGIVARAESIETSPQLFVRAIAEVAARYAALHSQVEETDPCELLQRAMKIAYDTKWTRVQVLADEAKRRCVPCDREDKSS